MLTDILGSTFPLCMYENSNSSQLRQLRKGQEPDSGATCLNENFNALSAGALPDLGYFTVVLTISAIPLGVLLLLLFGTQAGPGLGTLDEGMLSVFQGILLGE